MIEESEAREKILREIEAGPEILLPLAQARGLAVARDLRAVLDSPAFDNSSMDGYALRAAEAGAGAVLKVFAETQPAGPDLGLELPPGEAIRIFTGAPLPRGADAVIMQEDVERNGDEIRVLDPLASGENIRRRGGDVCAGQKIFSRGDRLGPAQIALLASQGMGEAPVLRRPRVMVVTTGDELVQSGPLGPGQIYDSNGILLTSAVEEAGGIGENRHLPDDPEAMRPALAAFVMENDFLVIAGGVSVGERDYVKTVLEEIGVETSFWKVRVKPGKPFLFGKHPGGGRVFGLPGNPVSAFVTFRIFVAPAIRKRLGLADQGMHFACLGEAEEEFRNPGDRPHYLRAIAQGGKVRMSGTQESHALFGLSRANCLARLEGGQAVPAGAPVQGLWI